MFAEWRPKIPFPGQGEFMIAMGTFHHSNLLLQKPFHPELMHADVIADGGVEPNAICVPSEGLQIWIGRIPEIKSPVQHLMDNHPGIIDLVIPGQSTSIKCGN